MTTEFDTEWARILAEAPTGVKGGGVKPHHPFRMEDGVVYTLRPETSCSNCVFDMAYHSKAERIALNKMCRAAPPCDGGAFAHFTPEDYTIMVARGDTDER